MLPDADIDDYVLVHVGVAISKVDEEEVKKGNFPDLDKDKNKKKGA